jgi:hypothetical protein
MKQALSVIAIGIAIASYYPYLSNMFAGKTKPHAFSWFIWGLLTGIGFFAQLSDHAGPGAWVTGFTAAICMVIFLFALKEGRRDIIIFDWICLFGAGMALGLWAITDSPLFSVILITIIDAIGFLPTFRKTYKKPFEETLLTYMLSAIKFVVAIMALENISLITTLYPASLVFMNGIFVLIVNFRRKQILAGKTVVS